MLKKAAPFVILLMSFVAHAGQTDPAPVFIDLKGRTAMGSLGGARNSADAVQRIGCSVQTVAAGTYATCYAIDAAGTWASCATVDPESINTARSLSGDSRLVFSWGRDGSCTSLAVENDSAYQPKR